MTKTSWIVLAIVVVLVLWVWGSYNGFVSANQAVDNQWAKVEGQYQRRLDLIPNLVATVQGIAKQEQTVFKALADARASYAGAKNVNEKVSAANNLEGALSRLLVIVENYPDLKSSQNFLSLQAQLEGTENRISVERARFNDTVNLFNVKTQRFPSILIGRIFGFHARAYFSSTAGAAVPPKVNF